MTIGIKWNAESWRVPDDEKKWLAIALRGFVRHNIKVAALPATIGGFRLLYVGLHPLVVDCYWQGKQVAILVDDPKDNGLPDDGDKPALQEQPALQKQAKTTPGFGWDPGYGDD